MQLTWFGHSSFLLEFNDRVVYVNPYAGEPEWYRKKANLVLVSSFEFDHWSRSFIQQVRTDSTHIFGPRELAGEMFGARSFTERQSLTFEDRTEIVALPSEEGIGWVISAEGKVIYFPSHKIDEKPYDHQIDVMVVPVSSTGEMSARNAAMAVNVIKPRIAIPAHYGRFAGTLDDAELFRELVEAELKTRVMILEVNRPAQL